MKMSVSDTNINTSFFRSVGAIEHLTYLILVFMLSCVSMNLFSNMVDDVQERYNQTRDPILI